jgi:hypothetical protein
MDTKVLKLKSKVIFTCAPLIWLIYVQTFMYYECFMDAQKWKIGGSQKGNRRWTIFH